MSQLAQASLQALLELQRAGDYPQLLEQARALLVTYPEELSLHSLAGAAQLELKAYQAAADSYRKALLIRPDFAKAHNGLGVACLRLGEPQRAAACFHEAIRHDPALPQAWFNLGIVYENRQKLTEAAGYFKQASLLKPTYCQALTALAKLLWELRRPQQVEAYFKAALAVNERYLPAHLGLMQFLEQSNQHEKLRAALARVREIEGMERLALLYEGILSDLDGHTQQARAQLEDLRIDPTDTITTHIERLRQTRLAQVCDRLEATDDAVRHARQANALARRLSLAKGIDKTRFLGFIAHRQRYFTATEIGRWRPVQDTLSRQPVFIIGFPRSGTTLLDTMLRGHPAIALTEESDSVARLVNRLSGEEDERLDTLATLADETVEGLRQDYHEAQRTRTGQDNAVIIDRFALNIIYVGELCRLFPRARFILLLRHPADCVLSCFLQTFYETSANASFHTLKDSAHLYDQVFKLWRQYRDVLPLNVHEIKYEDLIENPETSCRDMLKFLQLDWHPDILKHQQSASARTLIGTASYHQVTRPLYTKAINRWQRYRPELEQALDVLMPWMRYFKYSD